TEEDQYEAYKAVLEGMNGKPVVVRTMDIGGDKTLPYFDLPEDMTAQIKATIESKKVNAEAALKEITDMFIAIFEGMEDNAYMQ
ncbi:putative PEP-binding protein, partial [Lactococcus petauri]|uniref:putative PEP-binding protein n=1 Tax=Lactococcus petauri TaxID=1940789 RepID=UPI00254A440A